MSGFVLRRFTELVSEGVKTDKGFKELSGSLWDEDNCMISLAPDHYSGHVKVIESYEFLLVICFF